jgi:hypothetical protein
MGQNFRLIILRDRGNHVYWVRQGQNQFVNRYLVQGWHQTCHVPSFLTPITNQHNGSSGGLPTQHTP